MYPAATSFFVTPVLPWAPDGTIAEDEFRSLLRRYLEPRYLEAGLALIANPEAGEVFYLDRAEKRRVVEITVEEAAGRVPVYAGVIDTTTAGTVQVAKNAAAAGAQGLFVMPPIGALDVTTSWDANAYPEVFIDMLHAITAEVDLPMIVHPTSAPTARYGIGTGSWNYALEPMFEHIQAWRHGDVATAQKVWENGLAELQEYVYAENTRLHIRYKIACWLRGFISSPVMRAPLPRPRAVEVRTLADLLRRTGVTVIDQEAIDAYAADLT